MTRAPLDLAPLFDALGLILAGAALGVAIDAAALALGAALGLLP